MNGPTEFPVSLILTGPAVRPASGGAKSIMVSADYPALSGIVWHYLAQIQFEISDSGDLMVGTGLPEMAGVGKAGPIKQKTGKLQWILGSRTDQKTFASPRKKGVKV